MAVCGDYLTAVYHWLFAPFIFTISRNYLLCYCKRGVQNATRERQPWSICSSSAKIDVDSPPFTSLMKTVQ